MNSGSPTLADVCSSVRYGYTASASQSPIGPRFLRITDIVPDYLNWETVPYCPISESDNEKYRLDDFDIVVARTGATVGYAKMIRPGRFDDAVFASYLVRFRINPDLAFPPFIGRVIESAIYKRYVHQMVGGAAQPNANAKVLGAFPLLIPSLDSQKRISRILASYDDLIRNNRRRIALLEEAAQQLYKEWFVRLRFPGHENAKIVEGLPEGWTRVTFGDCATLLSGGTPSKKMARYWDGDIPWVTAKDLKVNRILDSQDHVTQEGAKNGTRLVPAGTILFVVRGMSLAKEFRVAMATRNVTFNQDLKALRIHEGVDPIFLFNFLLTSKHHIMGICGEAAHGTKKLETDRILGMPLLLPPENLQAKYASLARPAQEMMIRLDQQSSKLAEARDLLLPRLMSGEIEV